ncbi:hypothetical protein GCM10010276_23240 [Streptomyces longisporus]|uniref:Uncharacterized protein n=1 Tax=Streptomyces longisporus TaxID=1948 RepID=A0ABN3LIB4_STRLO
MISGGRTRSRTAPTSEITICSWSIERAGRKRGIEAEADRLRDIFRAEWAHQPPQVEDALGKQMLALLIQLNAACTAVDDLAKAVQERSLSTRTPRSC